MLRNTKFILLWLVCFVSLPTLNAQDGAGIHGRKPPHTYTSPKPTNPAGTPLPLPPLPSAPGQPRKQWRQSVLRIADSPIFPKLACANVALGKMNVPPSLQNSCVVLGPWDPVNNPGWTQQCPFDPTLACGLQVRAYFHCAAPAGSNYTDDLLVTYNNIPVPQFYNYSLDHTPMKMYKWDGQRVVCDTSSDVKRQSSVYNVGASEMFATFFPVVQALSTNPDIQAVIGGVELDITFYAGLSIMSGKGRAHRLDIERWIEQFTRDHWQEFGLPAPDAPGFAAGQSFGLVAAVSDIVGISAAFGGSDYARDPSPYTKTVLLANSGAWWPFMTDLFFNGVKRLHIALVQFLGQTMVGSGWITGRGYNVETVKNIYLRTNDACDTGYTGLLFWSQLLPNLNATVWNGNWTQPDSSHAPDSLYWPDATKIWSDAVYTSNFVSTGALAYWGYNNSDYSLYLDHEMLSHLPGINELGDIPGGNKIDSEPNLQTEAHNIQNGVYGSFSTVTRQELSASYASYFVIPRIVYWMNERTKPDGTIEVTNTPTPDQVAHANMSALNYYPPDQYPNGVPANIAN